MLVNLALGLSTMAVCLVLQSLLIIAVFRFYHRHEDDVNNPSVWASLGVVNRIMMLLVIGNLGQSAIWAVLFVLLGEFGSFAEAFYHSTVNFATLGYGDIVMSPEHRLLGPIEAVNGILMVGISTATLTATFQDALRKTLQARRG